MTQGSHFGTDQGRCAQCGAALTPDDYRLPSCRYCGAAHVHHQRAAEKVLQVQAMMGDANGNGIPDALEGMMGGMPGMAPPPGMPYAPAPPPGGYPAAQGAAVWQQVQYAQATMVQAQVARAASSAVIGIVITVVVLLLGIGGSIAFFLARE